MILCLDIGNSHIHGGVFDQDELLLQFRKSSRTGASSDEFGVFVRAVLRENQLDPGLIRQVAICSVVPEVVYPINACFQKYFGLSPFILQAGVKTGLQIQYKNPLEVGADRIANAIAARHLFPGKDLIIIDLGSASTFCAVKASGQYLGGVIMPGLKMSMDALQTGTSKLGSVEIVTPEHCLGQTTTASIQSGLYYGHRGAMNEVIKRLSHEKFNNQRPLVVATGGFTTLFSDSPAFDHIVPDLALRGLSLALTMNSTRSD